MLLAEKAPCFSWGSVNENDVGAMQKSRDPAFHRHDLLRQCPLRELHHGHYCMPIKG